MALLPIRIYPDPVLRKKCLAVTKITPEISKLLDDMTETMYEASGIGLAASQVGALHRVIVVDIRDTEEEHSDIETNQHLVSNAVGLLELINPEIISHTGSTAIEEGCLSIPEIRELVPRYSEVKIKALTREGKPFELMATGLLAICLQHEIDHLNGVLFVDRLGTLKKQLIKKKLKRLEDKINE